MSRYVYDLSSLRFQNGQVGRLTCVDIIPVVAGDSLEYSFNGVARLSPLRRQMMLDGKLEFYAFFRPHRHEYGQDWINFIMDGYDESVTFPGVNLSASGIRADCFAGWVPSAYSVPSWIPNGYKEIWNRYFRDPTSPEKNLDQLFPPGDQEHFALNYGVPCAHMRSLSNTGILATVGSDERKVNVSSNKVDLIDVERTRKQYKIEQERDWFVKYYKDVMAGTFGTRVGVDQDERPTLLAHQAMWLSGYDIDGTDDATLGDYRGKSATSVGFGFPRRFFEEHGAVFIMMLFRFPPIWENEMHYLARKVNPSYLEIAGDPDLIEAEPPHELKVRDIFGTGSSSTSLGTFPWGQWYRTHPNFVNDDYIGLQGFPFQKKNPTSREDAIYITPSNYDEMFDTKQLEQYQLNVRTDVLKYTRVPGPKSSIFAGV